VPCSRGFSRDWWAVKLSRLYKLGNLSQQGMLGFEKQICILFQCQAVFIHIMLRLDGKSCQKFAKKATINDPWPMNLLHPQLSADSIRTLLTLLTKLVIPSIETHCTGSRSAFILKTLDPDPDLHEIDSDSKPGQTWAKDLVQCLCTVKGFTSADPIKLIMWKALNKISVKEKIIIGR